MHSGARQDSDGGTISQYLIHSIISENVKTKQGQTTETFQKTEKNK
tara:strand:- start:556 stop:693 length:138 start_codon:yes stop_codon:yes gene_type:complete